MDPIPVRVWGLDQPSNHQLFTITMNQAKILPFHLQITNNEELTLITARTFIKMQKQILSSNKNPNVQVMVMDHNDLTSPDIDLYKSALNNLAFTSFCSTRTYVIICDLTRSALEDENIIELSDGLSLDLRRLCLHWPGRCYYSDLNQVIESQDWISEKTLSDQGQIKLANSLVRILNCTPREIFN